MHELVRGQRILEADAGGGARHLDEVRMARFLCRPHRQVQSEPFKYRLDLFYAQVREKAIFELVERGARQAGSLGKLRLRQVAREPGLADFVTQFLKSHEMPSW